MINPGHYSWCYPSSMVSKYHCWFVLLGYPELDINEYPDGSWEIVQYYRSPVVPSLTKWQMVLGPMRHVEISFGFCKNYVHQLDLHKKAFWAREEAKTKEVYEEADALDRHREDLANRAHHVITHTPTLMNRIAKNGLKEMDLGYIAKNIPKHEYVKPRKGVKVDVIHSSGQSTK